MTDPVPISALPLFAQATQADLPWVKAMADRHRAELGFVLRPALAEAIDRGELWVVGQGAFCEWHRRRDGWTTVYVLCSEQPGAGRVLLAGLSRPLRLKCPATLTANGFYAHLGGTLAAVEQRPMRRALNVWEWPA